MRIVDFKGDWTMKETGVMKITAINGSPKGDISNSREVISILASMLPPETECTVVSRIAAQTSPETYQFKDVRASDVLLLAFPLYVDGIPASLMRFLAAYEAYCRAQGNGASVQRVFAVCNCGFYEGVQNELALEMAAHFCASAGLLWCGGAGIGTGEMILGMKDIPPDVGIKKPVTTAFRALARAINEKDGRLEANVYAQHGIPWFLYKLAGEMGWRKMLKKSRLTRQALGARPLPTK